LLWTVIYLGIFVLVGPNQSEYSLANSVRQRGRVLQSITTVDKAPVSPLCVLGAQFALSYGVILDTEHLEVVRVHLLI